MRLLDRRIIRLSHSPVLIALGTRFRLAPISADASAADAPEPRVARAPTAQPA